MDQIIYIIGQSLGIVVIVLGFLTYQLRTREQVLVAHIATALCFSLHYLMIGAFSGMALNMVALIRNIVYYFLGKNGPIKKRWAILFVVIISAAGLLSWQGWYSILMVLGLIINTYFMSSSNPQNIRKSILVSSPLVLSYDVLVLSVGGAVYESVAIVSAVIGIIRNRKKQ